MNTILAGNPILYMLFRIGRILGLVYIGFMVYLAIFQRRSLYYPTRAAYDNLVDIASQNGLVPWHGADNQVIGWKPVGPVPAGADILLVCNGNAGFALHRIYLTEGFQRPVDNPAFHVFLLEYPGYGARPGTPTETSLKQAGDEAVRQLQQEYAGSRIFLAGESIGSGVAAWLAGERPSEIAGIFLITPFNRLVDVARHHYPIFPVSLLLRDRYESGRALTHYHGPVGILLAGKDTVVPTHFGKALYDGYQGPRQLWLQEERGHNRLDYSLDALWWAEATRFLRGTLAN